MFKATTLTMALLLSAATAALAAVPAIDLAPAQAQLQGSGHEAKRSKPRIPGGSGCDSPHDMAEHAECRTNRTSAVEVEDGQPLIEARRKPRVPGGSGCDSAHDRAEHPACRG